MNCVLLIGGAIVAYAVASSCTEDGRCPSSVDAKEGGWAMIQRKQQISKSHNLGADEEGKPHFQHFTTKDGQDWTTTYCPAGWYVTGGGCRAETDPFSYRHSAPEGNPPTAWRCGGNGTTKKVDVYCTKDFTTKVVSQNGGDWVEVHCPKEWKVTGGGCDARVSPFKFQASEPVGQIGWRCGGHGGAKTVWAVCTNSPRPIYSRTMEGGDWTQAFCDAGDQAIGGGCNAQSSPFYMRENTGRSNSWSCGGQGGKKKVTVICAAATPSPTPAPTPAPTLAPTLAPTEQPTIQKCSECVLQFNSLDVSPLDGSNEFQDLKRSEFRFKDVCANGPSADLILTVQGWKTKPSNNKVVGDLFQFNMKDGSMPFLTFDLVKPGTKSPLTPKKMYLSILDLDKGPSQTEYIRISSNLFATKWAGSDIESSPGKAMYETMTGGIGDALDNPTAGAKINADMAKNSVAFLFENLPKVEFRLGVDSTGAAGRSVYFGGRTPLVTDKLSCD